MKITALAIKTLDANRKSFAAVSKFPYRCTVGRVCTACTPSWFGWSLWKEMNVVYFHRISNLVLCQRKIFADEVLSDVKVNKVIKNIPRRH